MLTLLETEIRREEVLQAAQESYYVINRGQHFQAASNLASNEHYVYMSFTSYVLLSFPLSLLTTSLVLEPSLVILFPPRILVQIDPGRSDSIKISARCCFVRVYTSLTAPFIVCQTSRRTFSGWKRCVYSPRAPLITHSPASQATVRTSLSYTGYVKQSKLSRQSAQRIFPSRFNPYIHSSSIFFFPTPIPHCRSQDGL